MRRQPLKGHRHEIQECKLRKTPRKCIFTTSFWKILELFHKQLDIQIFAPLSCDERVGSCGRYWGTLNHYTIMNPASRNYCSMQQRPTRFSSVCLLCEMKRCVWCVFGELCGGLFVSARARCPPKGAARQIRKMAAPWSSDWMSPPRL